MHRVVAEKESARHREPRIAERVGVADKAGKVMPVRQINFRLRAINDGLSGMRSEADSRVVNLIVVRVVADEPAEIVSVQLEFLKEDFGQARLRSSPLPKAPQAGEGNRPGRWLSAAVELESRIFSKDGVWNTRS